MGHRYILMIFFIKPRFKVKIVVKMCNGYVLRFYSLTWWYKVECFFLDLHAFFMHLH